MRDDTTLLEIMETKALSDHGLSLAEFTQWARLKREAWESYISVRLAERNRIIDGGFSYEREAKTGISQPNINRTITPRA